ncbi:hypothetical protein AAFF_G00062470 [Aldrovandia affinis]|uniref:Large ribosomal subunit protein bL9m C-terminal domain-containing protein n=1 Tax=Aldrovandia affinis TaxID=143900 RepID=A0AAD7R1X7_9TELE|nr:hypothetical protein AAFF_G00062470 [Aldrovandia affinis]
MFLEERKQLVEGKAEDRVQTRTGELGEYWCEVTVNGMDTVRVPMSVVKFVNPRTLRHQRWLREQPEAQTTGSEEPAKDNP